MLLNAERSKKKTAADTTLFLNLLNKLAIESDAHTGHHATTTTLALGRRHKLSSYDAAYLELAMRLGLPLATLDKNLRKAARAEGIAVLPEKNTQIRHWPKTNEPRMLQRSGRGA